MSSEGLNLNFDQQFPAGPIPQVPAEPKLRRKRRKSLIKHLRNVSAEIAHANSDRNRKVYERVFAAYVELRGTAPIGACNIDPTGRANGVSFSGVEFMADVDGCVAATLGSKHDKFYALVRSELGEGSQASHPTQLSPVEHWRLTQRLGRSFVTLGLDPIEYFRVVRRKKYGDPSRQRTSVVEPTSDGKVDSGSRTHKPEAFEAGDFETGYQFGRIESQSSE